MVAKKVVNGNSAVCHCSSSDDIVRFVSAVNGSDDCDHEFRLSSSVRKHHAEDNTSGNTKARGSAYTAAAAAATASAASKTGPFDNLLAQKTVCVHQGIRSLQHEYK